MTDYSKTHELGRTSDGRWWAVPKGTAAHGEETAADLRQAADDFEALVQEHHSKHGLATYGCVLAYGVVAMHAAGRGELLEGTNVQKTRIEAIAHGVLSALGYEHLSPPQFRDASERVFKAIASASDGQIEELDLIDDGAEA